jgi:3-hydroxypropanoate dehydrogenase
MRALVHRQRALIQESAFRNSTLQGAYFIIAARARARYRADVGLRCSKVDAAFFAGTSYKVNFISTLGYGDPASIFGRLPRLDFEEANKIV